MRVVAPTALVMMVGVLAAGASHVARAEDTTRSFEI